MNSQTVYDLIPSDFEDIEGWNSFYTAYQETGRLLETQEIKSDLFAAYYVYRKIIRNSHQKIWFPGCGASLAPHVYAALGFRVWASDVSKVAIKIQAQFRQLPVSDIMQKKALKQKVASALPAGELHLCVHDFRQPFDEGDFDTVLNIKAFSRLSRRSMELAAVVHWQALKPKGQAIFWTLNVRGDKRDRIETALIKAGFLVSGHQTNRWYRHTLTVQTRISKVLNIGSAILNSRAECHEGPLGIPRAKWDSLRREYERRLVHEQAEIQRMLNTRSDIKVGLVINHSG